MHRNAAIIPRTVGDFVKSAGNLQPATDPFVHKIRNHRANRREIYIDDFSIMNLPAARTLSSLFAGKNMAGENRIGAGRKSAQMRIRCYNVCGVTQEYHLYFTMDI